MTVNRTTLLDLPLPVTGTESGTWGDTTNNGLTQYMDIAIAGMSNLTSANFTTGALTIETTEGNSSATNISATSAQYAGFRVTSLAQNSTITVGNTGTNPARSYRLINADATYTLTFKATGQTGITLQPGQTAVVAFNGTDYVIVGTVGAGSTTDNTVPRFDGTTGKILQSSGITIDDSNNVSGVAQLNITTLDATNIEVTNIKAKDGTAAASIADSTGVISVTANPVLSGGTANGVAYLNGSKVLTTGSALSFDGTNLASTTLSLAGSAAPTTANNERIAISNSYDATVQARYYGAPATNQKYLNVGWNVQTYGSGGSGYIVNGTNGIYSLPSGGQFISSADYTAFGALSANGFTNTGPTFSEYMRLTSTGLGIGTSSPGAKLDVQAGATSDAAVIRSTLNTNGAAVAGVALYGGNSSGTSVAYSAIYGNIDSNTVGSHGGGMRFYTATSGSFTEKMRLDSSGNLGLGVTPSAWGAGWKALQVNGFAAWSDSNLRFYLSNNSYFDGTNRKYIATGYASEYQQPSSGGFLWNVAASGTAGNAISFTQAMTLDASGNLGVGTTSPSGRLHVEGPYASNYVRIASGTDNNLLLGSGNAIITGAGSTDVGIRASAAMLFATGGGTERARITSAGYFKASDNGTYAGSALLYHELRQSADAAIGIFQNTNSSLNQTVNGITLEYTAASPNGTAQYFLYCNDSTALRAGFRSNGGLANYQGNDANLSDERVKTDIKPVGSYWNKIKAIEIVTFKYKDQTHDDDNVGVIAQQVESVAPEFVDVDGFGETPEDGVPLKAIYTTDMYHAAIKALQEAMARIETLEAKVAQLEGA